MKLSWWRRCFRCDVLVPRLVSHRCISKRPTDPYGVGTKPHEGFTLTEAQLREWKR